MTRLIATLLTLAACTGDDTTGTVNDPRAVLCDTFRTPSYEARTPRRACYFDIGDLDWAPAPAVPPAAGGDPVTIGGYCGPNCTSGGLPQFVEADTYKTDAIDWTGDTESGVAVVVGEFDFSTPTSEMRCIWKRCTRVE